MRNTLGWGRVAATALVGLALTGCDRGVDDLHKQVAEIKRLPGEDLDPPLVMQTFETFVYNADKEIPPLRDPFTPSVEEDNAGSGPRPDANRQLETLEAFPLDSLDMVGTIGAGKSLTALIKDPDGVVHRVGVGKYLGQNYGQIIQVFQDKVDLVELLPTGSGKFQEKPQSIALDQE